MTGQTFVDGGRRYKPTPDMPKVGDMELTFMYDSMDEILEAPVYKDLDEEHKKAFKKAAPGLLGAAYGVYMARRISKAAPDVLDAQREVNIEGDAQFFDRMQTAMRISASEALNRTEHFGEKGPSEPVLQSFLAYLETCANHAKFEMTNESLKEHEI